MKDKSPELRYVHIVEPRPLPERIIVMRQALHRECKARGIDERIAEQALDITCEKLGLRRHTLADIVIKCENGATFTVTEFAPDVEFWFDEATHISERELATFSDIGRRFSTQINSEPDDSKKMDSMVGTLFITDYGQIPITKIPKVEDWAPEKLRADDRYFNPGDHRRGRSKKAKSQKWRR